jgi:hypothetical protein
VGLDELKRPCQFFGSMSPSFVSDMAQNKCQISSLSSRILKEDFQTHEAIREQQSDKLSTIVYKQSVDSTYLSLYVLNSFSGMS